MTLSFLIIEKYLNIFSKLFNPVARTWNEHGLLMEHWILIVYSVYVTQAWVLTLYCCFSLYYTYVSIGCTFGVGNMMFIVVSGPVEEFSC